MKIDRVSAYQLELPLVEGVYAWSEGKFITGYDTTVLRIDTDEGITGWSEVCPLGSVYLPAYAGGVRAGILELAPHVLGQDPREIGRLNRIMDYALKGHPYVKSPFDIACWDILGKATGLSVSMLLGGRFGGPFRVYRSISQDTPELMAQHIETYRAEGFRAWQLKVGGGDPDLDISRIRAAVSTAPDDLIVADANTGWLTHEALKVTSAVRDLDIAVEQPCLSYEDCLTVRRHTSLPMVLDECIDDVGSLVRAHSDGAMDVVNIKIGKVGGLTKAKQLRDLCVSLGTAVTIEDMPGGDITGATILHLAQSTPERHRFSVTSSYLKVATSIAKGGPEVSDGCATSNVGPGLGIEPRLEEFPKPIIECT